MNIAVSQLVTLPANSTSALASVRTEEGRLYTIITAFTISGGTVRVRYLDKLGTQRLDYTISNPNPAIYAVGSYEPGTLEVTFQYASDVAARTTSLVIAKEISV